MGNEFLTQSQKVERMWQQICCLQKRVKELEESVGGNFVSKAGDVMDVDADLEFSNSLTPTQDMFIGTPAGNELGLYMNEDGGDNTAYQIGGVAINKASPIGRTRYLHREIYWLGSDNNFQQDVTIRPLFLPAGINGQVQVLNRNGFIRQNAGTYNVVGAVGTTTIITAIVDAVIIVDATDGDVIVEIPDGTNEVDGDVFTVIRSDNSAFTVSVEAVNGWQISGQPNVLLNQYMAVEVLYSTSAAQYFII